MAMANQGDRGNQIKRVGSNEIEIQCQRCDKLVTDRIECSGCKLENIVYIVQILPPPKLFTLIQDGELENFMWSFRSCRATFPSLENISCVLKDIQKPQTKNLRI